MIRKTFHYLFVAALLGGGLLAAGPASAQMLPQMVDEQPDSAPAALDRTRVTPVLLKQIRIPAGEVAKAPSSTAKTPPAKQKLAPTAATAPRKRAPQPFPEFSFKRLSPPAASATQRINVQIAPRPVPSAALPAPDADAAADAAAPLAADWFWAVVSPRLKDAAPHRFQSALAQLDKAPAGQGVAAPRLQDLQGIARAHGRDILVSSIGTGISPAFALAVIAVESSGRQGAVSPVGARGVMQLMPATAARFGVDPDISAQNIRGGIAYLDWLLKRFDGDPLLALAGYNAGENAVTRHEGVPPFAETRAYIPKVLAAWRVARGLCLTPPELIGDGCVFALESAAR